MVSCIYHPKNIYETAYLYYLITKFFGYASFSIVGNLTDGIVRVTPYDYIIYLLFLSIYCCILYGSFFVEILYTESLILQTGTQIIICSSIIISMIASTINVLFSRSIWNILKKLYEIDIEITSYGYKFNHQKQFYILLVLTIFYIFSICTIPILTDSHNEFYLISFIIYMIPNFNYSVIMSVHIMFMMAIYTRLRALNICFTEIFIQNKYNGIRTVKIVKTDERKNEYLISKFSVTHDKLNDTVELLNICFSVQIMLCVAVCFIYYTFSIFSAYCMWVNYNERAFYDSIAAISWAVYYTSYVIWVIALGSRVTREGKYTSVLIHKSINIISDGSMIKRLLAFSQQISHRLPVLTCGLFPFDWTLFYSACAATTTYLVILIQFDASMQQSAVN